jgi:hypothetical protein
MGVTPVTHKHERTAMTAPPEDLPTYRELRGRPDAPDGSSWRLWGDDDRLGTLNLLTPEATQRGLASATTGRVVPLNASVTEFAPPLFGREPMAHDVGVFSRGRVRDETLSGLNTQASSQWDGLGHVQQLGVGFYNGLEGDEHGIDEFARRGMATRGVLLDAEMWLRDRGAPIDHEAPHGITAEHLRGMLADLAEPVEAGDVLVLHTGWLDHVRGTGGPADRLHFSAPGLAPGREVLEVVWDTHCAAIVSDNPSLECWPPGASAPESARSAPREDRDAGVQVFMHYELIALLGVSVGEMWDTGGLARACRAEGRSTFLLTSAPLNVPGGVASPANALAVL